MKERIIQFGEGNFLRGFAEWFIQGLNDQKLFDGKVVLVQPIVTGPTDLVNAQKGEYNLYLRGLKDGVPVEEHTHIDVISRAVNPYTDYHEYLALARNPDMRFILSNTTEAGIVYDPACSFADAPPSAFPAKLTRLLFERYRAGLPGFVLLPCELIDDNGRVLQDCVHRYARQWNLGTAFEQWLDAENHFCCTLVDRIVTGYPKAEAESLCADLGYQDRLMVAGERFHLWVIEGNFEAELPLQKAGFHVVWTKDVAPYKKRKVRILNGAHTAMVCAALLCGLETVGDCMRSPTVCQYLFACVYHEIVPVLGQTEETRAFAAAVLERFKNPYICHQLRSIVLNSVSKFAVRVLPSILEYKEKFGRYPKCLTMSLAYLIYFYKTDQPQDLPEVTALLKERSVAEILQRRDIWGCDLSALQGRMDLYMDKIKTLGAEKAMEWILSE